MKKNIPQKKEYKSQKKQISNFVNSIDYMNKDISTEINNLNLNYYNNEILNIEINLLPYIDELNNRLKNTKISIQNEIELYE